MATKSLKRFLVLSIIAAVATIGLKGFAYLATGSVGLLSDALESFVNLLAAMVAYYAISIAEKPADEEHAFGHSKAEYFSSAIEGGLIVVAACSIVWSAYPRLLDPQPIENMSFGLIVSLSASLINLVVALVLLREGKKNHSITLVADGKHLMADVWTSVGVLAAVALVKITGWLILDPVIAMLVALNIVWTGWRLLRQSADGLIDTAIPLEERQQIESIFDEFRQPGIEFHSLMTRQAGQRRFVTLHMLVPGEWSVQKGHDLLELVESRIRNRFTAPVTVFTHLEPVEDPVAHNDYGIDRK
ncbi:MAG: cation diffusion facilitator family transporter [Marinilabiliales bacterium]|nr:cation diffusion facilitator family transporter [Marinilabiliales bacterium]